MKQEYYYAVVGSIYLGPKIKIVQSPNIVRLASVSSLSSERRCLHVVGITETNLPSLQNNEDEISHFYDWFVLSELRIPHVF